MTTSPDTEVAVVGAGPTGLLLAAELALAGVAVTVLERRDEPDPTIKAGSINAATAEILDRRGLRPAARAAHRHTTQTMGAFAAARTGRSASGSWQQQLDRQTGSGAAPVFPVTGHFAALLLRPDLVDPDDPGVQAHRGAAGSVLVTQFQAEIILGEHAAALGVRLRRGVEVTGLSPLAGDSGVELETSAGPLRAAWVVGADGGRSVIRKLAGIGFPGTGPETTGYQAIADLEGAEQLNSGWTWTPDGVYSYGPVPGRILTVQFTGPPADRAAPVTAEELQASIRLVSGTDVTVTALHGAATRWTDNARQAAAYRAGRVLLAGDAAHVHSPFSGQGLNLGAGDAVNLGWKLAATIAGWAPPGLLDTYDSERRPIGARVLDWTRAQVALMRGDDKTARLREVVAADLLASPASMTRVVLRTSGVTQIYNVGGDEAAAALAAGGSLHPLLGRLAGDLPLAGGGSLADHAHRGTFVLLDRTGTGSFAAAAAGWAGRLAIAGEPAAAGDCPLPYRDLSGLLVRPDGVIAWAADHGQDSEPSPAALVRALRRWAGDAAAAS